jgi:hypothetical protein
MIKTREEGAALLRKRIDESGLSHRRFARDVMIRDERTVRRWFSGDGPIPSRVMEWLLEPKVSPWPKEGR